MTSKAGSGRGFIKLTTRSPPHPDSPKLPRRRSVWDVCQGAFVPPHTAVPAEYWRKRATDHAQRVLDAARQALTAQAWLIAVGVGKVGATPLASIIVSEINSVASRLVGLALASLVPSSTVAAHARAFVALDYVLSTVFGLFSVGLLAFPEYLQSITLAEAVVTAVKGVVTVPAQAALWAHMQKSADSRVRAEVSRRNSNQTRVVQLLCMGATYATLTWAGGDLSRVVPAWCALSMATVLVSAARLRLVVPPDLNHERLRCALAAFDAGNAASVTTVEIARQEQYLRAVVRRPQPWSVAGVRVGVPLSELWVFPERSHAADKVASAVQVLLRAHASEPFVVGAHVPSCRVTIALKAASTPATQLRATFVASRVAGELRRMGTPLSPAAVAACITRQLSATREPFRQFKEALARGGFNTRGALLRCGDWRLAASKLDNGSLTETRLAADGSEERRVCACAPASRGGADAGAVGEVCAFVPVTPAGPSSSHRGGSGAALQYISRAVVHIASRSRRTLAQLLLPTGYPHSVAPEYMHYQLWDTLQVMCADLRGAITQQAGLLAIGVGSVGASPEGVIVVDMITTLVREALSLVVGSAFRADSSAAAMKTWRIYTAGVSLFSAACTLVAGALPARRLHLRLADTTVSACVSPLAGGANSALVLHLAKGSVDAAFVADVGAKERNQDQVLGLVLLASRYTLLLWTGVTLWRAWAVLLLLSAGHLGFNYLAARALVEHTINRSRAAILAEAFPDAPTPDAVAAREGFVPRPWVVCTRPSSMRVQLGVSPAELVVCNSGDDAAAVAAACRQLVRMFRGERFVVGAKLAGRQEVRIALRDDATGVDHLKAVVLARRLVGSTRRFASIDECVACIRGTLSLVNEQWGGFVRRLQVQGWQPERTMLSVGEWRLCCE